MEEYHRPVLLKEVINALKVEDGSWYLDATVGDGGYSLEIIKRGGKVLGLDVDPMALDRAGKRLPASPTQRGEQGTGEFRLIQGNFRELKNLIPPVSPNGGRGKQTETDNFIFKGTVFDLGVSSLQLTNPGRGFSFSFEGPLDMRMDPTLGVRALDLINILSRKELYELFSKLGEEKYARKLADALVSSREVGKGTGYRVQGTGIKTTKDLADFVERVVGGRGGKLHPATRVFQALRIAVNDELNALKEGLDQAKDLIEKNGNILVVSFHSLEDRIVKTTFREWEFEGLGKILTKKPIVPTEEEVRDNPRSRSAKLRVFSIL